MPQEPRRVVPGAPAEVKPVYRELKQGEERVEGLLQRVECPTGRPVTFVVKLKDRVAKYQAPRLDAVEIHRVQRRLQGPDVVRWTRARRPCLADLEDRGRCSTGCGSGVPTAEIATDHTGRGTAHGFGSCCPCCPWPCSIQTPETASVTVSSCCCSAPPGSNS